MNNLQHSPVSQVVPVSQPVCSRPVDEGTIISPVSPVSVVESPVVESTNTCIADRQTDANTRHKEEANDNSVTISHQDKETDLTSTHQDKEADLTSTHQDKETDLTSAHQDKETDLTSAHQDKEASDTSTQKADISYHEKEVEVVQKKKEYDRKKQLMSFNRVPSVDSNLKDSPLFHFLTRPDLYAFAKVYCTYIYIYMYMYMYAHVHVICILGES